jgi:glycerol-3-phosphate acyltransferase PlsX
MEKIRLAVDAMGGDYAPTEIVAGAVQGVKDLDVELLLVGDPNAIQKELADLHAEDLSLKIIPASDVIHMDERPTTAVKSKPSASINVACRVVVEGQADGVVTMGHTGAGMISALAHFKRIPGVERPAAIAPFLGFRDDLYIIDGGANTEVRPNQLLQFAQMGSVYLEHTAGLPNPKIGLLSNGAESNKGNKIGRAAYPLLEGAKGLNFVGNVEGHTLLKSDLNLFVADGFVGNILFKSAEGILNTLLYQFAEVIPQLPLEAAELVTAHLKKIQNRNDYASVGAAILLGVQHPILIGHGRSKAKAVRSGMATAKRMIALDVVGKIRESIGV